MVVVGVGGGQKLAYAEQGPVGKDLFARDTVGEEGKNEEIVVVLVWLK